MNVSILNHEAWNCAKIFKTDAEAVAYMLAEVRDEEDGYKRAPGMSDSDFLDMIFEDGQWSLEDGELMFEVTP